MELLKCSNNWVKQAKDFILLCFVSFPWSASKSKCCREQAAHLSHSPASTWGNEADRRFVNVFYFIGATETEMCKTKGRWLGRQGKYECEKNPLGLGTASWALLKELSPFRRSTGSSQARHPRYCPLVPHCLWELWVLSTLQDEACSEEEREVQEYDEDLELVIPFLTLLKEMAGFIFLAVNSTSLLVLQVYTCTCCWFLYSYLPQHTIKYTWEFFYRCVRIISAIIKMKRILSVKALTVLNFREKSMSCNTTSIPKTWPGVSSPGYEPFVVFCHLLLSGCSHCKTSRGQLLGSCFLYGRRETIDLPGHWRILVIGRNVVLVLSSGCIHLCITVGYSR